MKTFREYILSFKVGTVITTLIALVWTLSTVFMLYYNIMNKIDRLKIRQDHVAELYQWTKQKYMDTIDYIKDMEEEQHAKDLDIIEIKTKLTWIETTLLEIKKQLLQLIK